MENYIKTEKTDFESITRIFESALKKGRNILYEHEVYELLEISGLENIPQSIFLEEGTKYSDEILGSIRGERVVLKIVSPDIIHKSRLGGVQIVENSPSEIRSTAAKMKRDVLNNFISSMESKQTESRDSCSNLFEDMHKSALKGPIHGVLVVQHIPHSSELILGIRNSREFGMIINAGPGGIDTEMFARYYRKNRAFITASTSLITASSFLDMFRNTITAEAAAKNNGLNEAEFEKYISFFIELGSFFSPSNPSAPFIIEELEINPLAFTRSHACPLDGFCRFSLPVPLSKPRPLNRIDRLLHPESIGILGVSTTRINFGRIILDNIVAMGFSKENIRIIHKGMDTFEGISCVPDLDTLDIIPDLLVVAVGADRVLDVIEKVTSNRICESVMLITGGIGETSRSKDLARHIVDLIETSRVKNDYCPVFLGANCLGVVSHAGKYDTMFIPEEKLPKQRGKKGRNTVFISQSGAFMIMRISRMPELDPAYMISVGNQNDITLGDMISYFHDMKYIDVIAVYAEGFKDLDGYRFIESVRKAVSLEKDVLLYRAGRTSEGRAATGSHTATIAGDYDVCDTCVRQAGGIVAGNFTQFDDLLFMAQRLNRKKIAGNRIAGVSGAGFEAVAIADNIDIDDFQLQMACLEKKTVERINRLLMDKGISGLTEAGNPLDFNPAADDETHLKALEYLAEDPNVDAIVMGLDPLSPVTLTLEGKCSKRYDFNRPGSMAREMPHLVEKIQKPVIGIIDGGRLFDAFADELINRGMVVFRSSDRAVKTLAQYIGSRLNRIRG